MYDKIKNILNKIGENGMIDPMDEILSLIEFQYNIDIEKGLFNNIKGKKVDDEYILYKRKKGYPFEYIFNKCYFNNQTFYCNQDTMIPTNRTISIVEYVKKEYNSNWNGRIIDIGTGCGNLAISLKMLFPNSEIFATDISLEALESAKINLEMFDLIGQVKILQSDLFKNLDSRKYINYFDLIICNPPYIPTMSIEKLDDKYKVFGPKTALDGGKFGLDVLFKLIEDSPNFLKDKAKLIFETLSGHSKLLLRYLKNSNFFEVKEINEKEEIVVFVLEKLSTDKIRERIE